MLGDDEAAALVALAVVVGVHVVGCFNGHGLALVALHLVGVVLVVIVATSVVGLGADHLVANVADDIMGRSVGHIVNCAVVLAHIGAAAVAHAVVVVVDVRLLA